MYELTKQYLCMPVLSPLFGGPFCWPRDCAGCGERRQRPAKYPMGNAASRGLIISQSLGRRETSPHRIDPEHSISPPGKPFDVCLAWMATLKDLGIAFVSSASHAKISLDS